MATAPIDLSEWDCGHFYGKTTRENPDGPQWKPVHGPAWPEAHPPIDGSGTKQVMQDPKTPLQLLIPQFLEGVSEVLLIGAQKYHEHQWAKGMYWMTVFGGVLRHLCAFARGEEVDKETGLPHLCHATCGIMFLFWYAHGPHRAKYDQFDNRAFKA